MVNLTALYSIIVYLTICILFIQANDIITTVGNNNKVDEILDKRILYHSGVDPFWESVYENLLEEQENPDEILKNLQKSRDVKNFLQIAKKNIRSPKKEIEKSIKSFSSSTESQISDYKDEVDAQLKLLEKDIDILLKEKEDLIKQAEKDLKSANRTFDRSNKTETNKTEKAIKELQRQLKKNITKYERNFQKSVKNKEKEIEHLFKNAKKLEKNAEKAKIKAEKSYKRYEDHKAKNKNPTHLDKLLNKYIKDSDYYSITETEAGIALNKANLENATFIEQYKVAEAKLKANIENKESDLAKAIDEINGKSKNNINSEKIEYEEIFEEHQNKIKSKDDEINAKNLFYEGQKAILLDDLQQKIDTVTQKNEELINDEVSKMNDILQTEIDTVMDEIKKVLNTTE